MRRSYVADFETQPFLLNAKENYKIDELFVNFQEFYSGEHNTFILNANNWSIEVREKIDKKIYGQKEDLRKFLKSLCSIRNPTYLYFHNLKFDFKFLSDYLPTEYCSEIVQNKGKILEIKLFKEYKIYDKRIESFRIQRKYVLHIRDSLVLLLVSVDELGKALKFPKGKVNYDCNISEEYIEYCRQDCRIVRKALWNLTQFVKEQFIPEFVMEKMPLTLPSLAKKCWEYLMRKQMGENAHRLIFDPYANQYEDFFRNYYFGGRVEVFDFNQQQKVGYNDVNSYYPSIMHKYAFPLPPYQFIDSNEYDYPIQDVLQNPAVFAVYGEINEQQHIPLVPIRTKEGKILFANGTKRCFLFREELDYLTRELHQSILIKKICLCESWEYVFQEFVTKTYFQRKLEKDKGKNANEFLIYLLKIFQNSLYGKFAESKLKEHIQFMSLEAFQQLPEEEHSELLEKAEIVEYGDEEYAIIREEKEHKIDINIFIAMRITALCRLDLHKKMCKMSDLSYCDTDSLVGTPIENSTDLGRLKVEFYADKFQALGCKEYAYCKKEVVETIMMCNFYNEDVECKMKGFGKVKYDEFEAFIIEYLKPKRQWRPAGFFEILSRGLAKNEVVVAEKEKRAFYDKRWINSDFTTKPFNLDFEDFEELLKNNQKMLRRIIDEYKKR